MPARWNRIDIAGHLADVFEPTNPLPLAVLFLHDEPGPSPALLEGLASELQARRLRCVVPHGTESWWVDRLSPAFDPALTPERYLLDRVLPWLESTWSIGARAVAAVGVGMGGQGAVRLGFRYPERFPIVASLDGAFDFHEHHGRGTPLDTLYATREQARQDTAILHIHGHDWPRHIWFASSPSNRWYRGNDRLHEKLSAMGVPHTAELDAASDFKSMLSFVATALAAESRRLA
jgi:S-formylglutathione hydrolase FrmB